MKTKKLLAFVMASAMVLSMAACGGSSSSGNSGSSDAAADNSGSTDTADTQTFKLGSIGPLTGDYAIYGMAVVQGAELAVNEINASDSKIKFEFQKQDDEGDGEKAVNAYNTMMDHGLQVLVGPTTTGASIAVADVCYNDRTFMLTPSASSTDVTANKDNVFQVCFTDPNQGTGAADYMAENMSGAKVAVIYQNDIAYSQGIRDTFVAEAEAKSLEVVYEGTFTADTKSDFSVQLTAAQSAGADLLFLPIYYQEASVILNQANQMGYTPTFFGVDGMDGILTLSGFDTSLAEGVMLLTPFNADATDEATVNFVTKYQELYGETPNQFAADAYDCVYAFKQALETAGCTPDMSNEELCDALIATFPTITFNGLTGDGDGITWDASGEVSKSPKGMIIENGAYVGMD